MILERETELCDSDPKQWRLQKNIKSSPDPTKKYLQSKLYIIYQEKTIAQLNLCHEQGFSFNKMQDQIQAT